VPTNKSQIKINGNDLKKLGFKEGKELGQTLKIIENLVYEEKLNNDKKEIINYIKSNILNVD
jgi:polyA polymerase family protein